MDYKRMWLDLETRVANEKDNLELKDCLASCLDEVRRNEERSLERDESIRRAHKDFRSVLEHTVTSIVQRRHTPTGKKNSITSTEVNFKQVTGRYDHLHKADVMEILGEEFREWYSKL